MSGVCWRHHHADCDECYAAIERLKELRQLTREELEVIAYVRRNNEDGTVCSVEREMLAQQLETGMHWR